ncbi:MAG: dethiobiotin synthase [Verrucomicrobiota bacterium]
MGHLLFVTGTDTGAGKTLLTSLLALHLRQTGRHALAMKPFCTGGWEDVQLLGMALAKELAPDEINPFHFPDPVAPLIAARRQRRPVQLQAAVSRIQAIAARCQHLLIEGAGGLLVPLGKGYTVADLITRLQCPVVVAARNRLGVVNHALLTLAELRRRRVGSARIVLMNGPSSSLATRTNAALIAEFSQTRVLTVPYLGPKCSSLSVLNAQVKKLKKTLAAIVRMDTVTAPFRGGERD